MHQCIRTHKLTESLAGVPLGHKLWPALVHVHIVIRNGALMHTVHSYSNHQTSQIVDKRNVGTDITILVATLLKLMLKPSAFSDSCKSYPFLCNTSGC